MGMKLWILTGGNLLRKTTPTVYYRELLVNTQTTTSELQHVRRVQNSHPCTVPAWEHGRKLATQGKSQTQFLNWSHTLPQASRRKLRAAVATHQALRPPPAQ